MLAVNLIKPYLFEVLQGGVLNPYYLTADNCTINAPQHDNYTTLVNLNSIQIKGVQEPFLLNITDYVFHVRQKKLNLTRFTNFLSNIRNVIQVIHGLFFYSEPCEISTMKHFPKIVNKI